MLWCVGAIRDSSPEAEEMLNGAVRESADPRPALAAAIAIYRIKGQLDAKAHPLYRQLAAARWFADSFLAGVPWDLSTEVEWDDLLANAEPDPVEATRLLLRVLEKKAEGAGHGYTSIVHDLLTMNFEGGNWRQCTQLTSTQAEVLRRLVETDSAWSDTKRLWFLMPEGFKGLSQIGESDVRKVRDDMRSVLNRARVAR
jgi:hypothetical protein